MSWLRYFWKELHVSYLGHSGQKNKNYIFLSKKWTVARDVLSVGSQWTKNSVRSSESHEECWIRYHFSVAKVYMILTVKVLQLLSPIHDRKHRSSVDIAVTVITYLDRNFRRKSALQIILLSFRFPINIVNRQHLNNLKHPQSLPKKNQN